MLPCLQSSKFAWLIFGFAIALLNADRASAAEQCRILFQGASTVPRTTLEIINSFSQGLIPDIEKPDQKNAFIVYLKIKAAETEEHQIEKIEDLKEILKKTQIEPKIPFRPVRLSSNLYEYRQTAVFTPSLKSMVSLRRKLIDPNEGRKYWSQVLGGEQEAKNFFQDPRLSNWLAGGKGPDSDIVNRYLNLAKALKDRKAPQQSLVDLAASYALEDKQITNGLRSTDGSKQISAFKSLLSRRASFAVQLGFKNYEDLLMAAHANGATDSDAESSLQKIVADAEVSIEKSRQATGDTSFTVRPLSLAEAPFRSCFGKDCATGGAMFAMALEKRMEYFTLTDDQGNSSGHIDVILGSAKTEAGRKPTAKLYRVQNVDDSIVTAALEAVRLTLADKGYTLGIAPDFAGSNEASTVSFVRNRLVTFIEQHEVWKKFERAEGPSFVVESKPASSEVKPLLPLKSEGTSFSFGEAHLPWKLPAEVKIDLNQLHDEVLRLKSGSSNDRSLYIDLALELKELGLEEDPDFESMVVTWVKDASQPIALKKKVFSHWVREARSDLLLKYRTSLTNEQQAELIDRLEQEGDSSVKYRILPIAAYYAKSSYPLLQRLLDGMSTQEFQRKNSIAQIEKLIAQSGAEPGAENYLKYAALHYVPSQLKQTLVTFKPIIKAEPGRFRQSINLLTQLRMGTSNFEPAPNGADVDVEPKTQILAGGKTFSVTGKEVVWQRAGKEPKRLDLAKETGKYGMLMPNFSVDNNGFVTLTTSDSKLITVKNGKLISVQKLGEQQAWGVFDLDDGNIAHVARNQITILHEGGIITKIDLKEPCTEFFYKTGPQSFVLSAPSGKIFWFENGRSVGTAKADSGVMSAVQLRNGELVAASKEGVTWFRNHQRVAHTAVTSSGELRLLVDGRLRLGQSTILHEPAERLELD